MIELFKNVSDSVKKQVEFVFEMAMQQENLLNAVNVLNEYTKNCYNDENREFAEFYFKMRMEQLKDGNSNN